MISTMTVLGIFLLIFVVKLDCLCAFSSSIKMAVECLVVLLLITISTSVWICFLVSVEPFVVHIKCKMNNY